jgi:extracellular elastinolytic metalloproteinase
VTSPSPRRRHRAAAAIALLTATLVPGLAQLPALADDEAEVAATQRTVVPDVSATYRGIGDAVLALPAVDTRGRALPTLLQRRAVQRLGDVDLRWNRFGTPASILPADGVLARATSTDPVVAARAWLGAHADVFGITRAQVAQMQAIAQPLVHSSSHAVFFRQTFDGLLPAIGSAVTVGVGNGEIVYVSSSITRTTQRPPAATITPAAGWLKAAADVGLDLPVDLGRITRTVSDGWTRLQVPGVVQEQQVRLRALANADGSVRPVLEANVVDVAGGGATAYTVLIDGVSGRVLHRQNQVLNHSDVATGPSAMTSGTPSGITGGGLKASEGLFPFTGSITPTACGPRHAFTVTGSATRTITVVANMLNPANDITVNLYRPDGSIAASQDLLTSPEVLSYAPSEPIGPGSWKAEVCPFEDAAGLPPATYNLVVATSDTAAGGGAGSAYNPRWRIFTANPTLDSPTQVARNTEVGCWLTARGCTVSSGQFNNVAAFTPWDVLTTTGLTTGTTTGNNATTREAWASPLTPGGLLQAPVSATGDYRQPFTDAWNNSRCNPAELVPGGNDILFSVANLFVSHNRMHDFSYYLGFTERNYNLQLDNGGRGGVEADPEVGNVQAGALTSPVVTETGVATGRNNANQITLQDGVVGITNQYLFQPLAGSFYAPCTDGGLDMGIVGHEYTHAINGRMVGGPDEGLTSEQGGAMNESWADQVAGEYQFSHGYSNGGNIWAIGAYATGNLSTAIRNYSINKNPLNFSNRGYDSTGPAVHSDGEIWNGTNWEVRQALVEKYDRKFPYRDKKLQLECAQGSPIKGVLRPYKCPGNRRWIQLMFDSMLLQQGATSMIDARDAMIAADKLRFRGANKLTLWDAFARRGLGVGARTRDADDVAPTPSFASVGGRGRNVRVTFKTVDAGRVFVGDYEQRSRPVADTSRSTRLPSSALFTPGTYDMLYVGTTHGHMRFRMTVPRNGRTKVVRIRTTRNHAAARSGAKVIGVRGAVESRRPQQVIDGSEDNGWGVVTDGNVDAVKPAISIDLAGRKPVTIRSVSVSSSLRPAYGADADAGSRFTALRKFAVEACVRACSTSGARWKRFYTSPDNAFPSRRPRPTAPTLVMRAFATKPTRAAALRLVVLENQCTGYAGYAGELDADPLNPTDCRTGSDRGTIAHVTEVQAFSSRFGSWRSSYGIDNPERSIRRGR